ncbi:hypothetical protein CEUSTIGMA_g4292.t1 [Chlamydomonas eustigma]|uniref:Uncharacterized protein n=1 Tax=Chlamydomonas eustigma TaxID=1157962 RepID=A0A250X1B4_9CHLO|nr:hypothetical protein CEUSTIGMA_g4292.t1 [Chlamydomonas eustigma]|eukprot:GAX76846.1 hypothetical protein CEUSTIGMA_g4292.t1 [Chlamydomonas eustigma]
MKEEGQKTIREVAAYLKEQDYRHHEGAYLYGSHSYYNYPPHPPPPPRPPPEIDAKPTWGARPFVPPAEYKSTEKEWEDVMKDLEPDVVLDNWDEDTFNSVLNSSRPITGFEEKKALRKAIDVYVNSSEYKDRVIKILNANMTGIVIPAGGPQLLTNMLVTLKVLREHHKSSLPVEVMWQGASEMEDLTWSHIESLFSPVKGVNVQKFPHPVPSLLRRDLILSKYTGKVFSLLASEFRHVLMVDADCMPLQKPEQLFAHPQYLATGNLFWPDVWQDKVKDSAFELHGLKAGPAREIINAGKGYSPRDTESGQVLIDRGKHLDVLEYLLWINSYPADFLNMMWGDKDTFGIAFALAEKAHLFSQVAVPPAGLFSWRKDMLLHKDSEMKSWGWQLFGFLQHDSWGRPAFLHRTINKYIIDAEPWAIEMVTAPIPYRWTRYYLDADCEGPTVGVPWDYVIPASAVTLMNPVNTPHWVHVSGNDLVRDASLLGEHTGIDSDSINKRVRRNIGEDSAVTGGSSAQGNGSSAGDGGALSTSVEGSNTWSDGCPVNTFLSIWSMRESGLPIDMISNMLDVCMPVLQSLLGAQEFEQYRLKGWLETPALRYMNRRHMTALPASWQQSDVSTPIPAWLPDLSPNSTFQSSFTAAVSAAYDAHTWLSKNAYSLFPLLLYKPPPYPPHPPPPPEQPLNPPYSRLQSYDDI